MRVDFSETWKPDADVTSPDMTGDSVFEDEFVRFVQPYRQSLELCNASL